MSPFADTDLSGFETIVYLDTPVAFAGAYGEGKKTYYNREVNGKRLFEGLNAERGELVKMFTALKNNAGVLQGENARALTKSAARSAWTETNFYLRRGYSKNWVFLIFRSARPRCIEERKRIFRNRRCMKRCGS